MKTVRIGMLGYGSMGRTHHYAVDCLRHFYPEDEYTARVEALCARTEATRSVALRAGIARVTDDMHALIADPDIDVIDICTPNIYHFDAAREALLHGKHVYCEKPLAVTAQQADELADLAEKSGLAAQVVFNTRFLPAIRRAKQLTDSGALGRILSFRCAYLHASCTDPHRPAGWKQNREICGGGVWFDLGAHAVDLVYHLCGEFESIEGHGQIAYPTRIGTDGKEWKTNADEAFYAVARLKCGAMGTIEASKLALGANDDFTLEVYGERGSIRFSLMDPNFLSYYDGTAADGDYGRDRGFTRIECVGRLPKPAYPLGGQKAPVGWLRGHSESYHAFLNCVTSGEAPCPSFRDAAHVQHVLEDAYRSDHA